jgi:hypothetical protein
VNNPRTVVWTFVRTGLNPTLDPTLNPTAGVVESNEIRMFSLEKLKGLAETPELD